MDDGTGGSSDGRGAAGSTEPPARTAPRVSGFNRFMIRLLASPFADLAGGLVLVRYTGRRSGEARQLVVGCDRLEDGFLIIVGRPDQKTWWRNFMSPWPVDLGRGRSLVHGTAIVVRGNSERGLQLAAGYFAAHRGRGRRAGLPKLRKGEVASPGALRAAAAPLVFVLVTPAA